MLTFSIYLVFLLIPGFLLLAISNVIRGEAPFKVSAYTYLVSVSLSYAIIIILLLFFRLYGDSASVFFLVYLLFLFAEILLLTYLFIKNNVSLEGITFSDFSAGKLIFLSSISLSLLYFISVGPYLEIPADAWWHLGEIQSMYQLVKADALPVGDFYQVIRNQNGFWYYVAAAVIYWSGSEYTEALNSISYVNNLVFLTAVYCFALLVLKRPRISCIEKHSIAAFAMTFALLHFGVSEFSFVRYYTYAPVMLNFVLYFASIILIFKYMQTERWMTLHVFFLMLFVITMALVHLQEILLLSVITFGVILYRYGFNKVYIQFSDKLANKPVMWNALLTISNKKISVLFYAAISFYLFIHIYMILTDSRHFPFELPEIIPYESILPFMDGLGMVLLDPRTKFYEVITFWGIIVYILYFIKIKEFIDNPYLMVGMLLPFFTVFNPIFTDFFFRFSWAEVLYRICYIIPLSTMAGYLFVTHVRELFDNSRVFLKKFYNISAIFALIVFLFPFNSSTLSFPSRIVTLVAIDSKSDHRNWNELVSYLNNKQSKTTIHTDRITGYVLKALTHHRYRGYKFTGQGAEALTVENIGAKIDDMADELLIINLKSGVWSDSGSESGHWPGNVLNMEQYYSSEFLKYIRTETSKFDKLWEKDGIAIYKIIGSK